jgi:hypothetical protein
MNGTGANPAVHPKGHSAKLPSGLWLGTLAASELARPRVVLARFGAGSFDSPAADRTQQSVTERQFAGTDCLRDPARPGAPASGGRLNSPGSRPVKNRS